MAKKDCGCGHKKKDEASTTGDVAGYSEPLKKHQKTISELLKELEEILNKTK